MRRGGLGDMIDSQALEAITDLMSLLTGDVAADERGVDMTNRAPIRLAESEGELLWYDGGLITFKATGKQTDESLLFFEIQMPVGKATPLHIHPQSDETFYLLEGEILVHSDGTDDTAGPGAVVSIPRGTPHAFMVKSPTARMLVSFTPADPVSEAFFREVGEPASAATLSPSPPPTVEEFMGAAKRSGMQILGPPPFAASAVG